MEKTLTESEKIEQLMTRRYKVIADYPDSRLRIGDIIEDGKKEYEWWINNRDQSKWTFTPDSYPAIFRKLEWWEFREPNEMPEYVKDEVTGKILKIEYRIDSHTPCDVKTWNEFEKPFWNILQDLIPATEAEYNEYLTASK